jgi:hypothetical protein
MDPLCAHPERVDLGDLTEVLVPLQLSLSAERVEGAHDEARGVAAWTRAHPDDVDCARMVERFVASPAFEAHRPAARGQRGSSIEEAFYVWCSREGLGDDRTRAQEFMAAMARALTVCPDPEFSVPEAFRRVPGGWCAVLRGDPPWLFAAVHGRCVTGAITALAARLLEGETPDGDDAPVAAELRAMGLLG